MGHWVGTCEMCGLRDRRWQRRWGEVREPSLWGALQEGASRGPWKGAREATLLGLCQPRSPPGPGKTPLRL